MGSPAPEPSVVVFISYSWDSDLHKQWVRDFAMRLRGDGLTPILDQWDLKLGARLPHFMEGSVRDSDRVLVICTPGYKSRSDLRRGGVGYEGHVITAEILGDLGTSKFIAVLRSGDWSSAVPTWLAGTRGVNLSDNPYKEEEYTTLVEGLKNSDQSNPQPGDSSIFQRSATISPATTNDRVQTGVASPPTDVIGQVVAKAESRRRELPPDAQSQVGLQLARLQDLRYRQATFGSTDQRLASIWEIIHDIDSLFLTTTGASLLLQKR